MKNLHLFVIKGLLVAFSFTMFISCDEGSLEIPYYEFSRISKYERDSLKTFVTYGVNDRLSGYEIYIHDSLAYKSTVQYSYTTINCVIDDVLYNVQLSNTRGGLRAENMNAFASSGSRLYYVEYEYDDEGRLWRARLDGIDTKSIYSHYKYEGNTIIIDDAGTEYRLSLSSEENLGYVCNVLDYAEAPITSKYIINPDLYFLNIYGAPIEKLPYGHAVTRCNNGKNLSRVGKYFYEY